MKSLTYYLTLLVIKMKGVKKEFSKDPIDYKKLRKEDTHSPAPGKFKHQFFRQFSVGKTTVSEIKPVEAENSLIFFCHGGAFVYGPVDYHWDAAKRLAKQTENKVWLIDYPKAPEQNIQQISKEIDDVYQKALKIYPAKKIILVGDSVGGTLLTALVQRQIGLGKSTPGLLILISPVMDASFSNPLITKIDKSDPILSRAGALSAKKLAAASVKLKDPILSPLYGSFNNFSPTVWFIAENDISRPDTELAVEKMRKENVEHEVIFGEGMPHIWPILPVMQEGKKAFSKIVTRIKALPIS